MDRFLPGLMGFWLVVSVGVGFFGLWFGVCNCFVGFVVEGRRERGRDNNGFFFFSYLKMGQ